MTSEVRRSTAPSVANLQVLYFIDSLSVGGAEISLVAFAQEYRALGVELHVAYLRPHAPLAKALEAAGAILHPIAGPQRRISWIRKARRLISELEPDVIHTSLFEADVVGRAAAILIDTPLVSSFVTDSYGPEHLSNPEYRRWKVRGAQLADLLLARRVDHFHAVSDNAAALMSRRLLIDRDSIDVVPRGRDPGLLGEPSLERRLATREGIGLAPDVPLIVAAARHYHVKGLDTLVSALPAILTKYPDAMLFIAGREGPATETLQSLVDSMGIESNVVFAGYRSDVPDLFAAADVFVLPSRAEGCPGTLIEAMAVRVPIVTADIPSVREVAGSPPVVILVPLDDHRALADSVLRLLDDEELRSQLTADAHRRFMDHFTVDQMGRRMMGVYSKALGSRRGAAHRAAQLRFDAAGALGIRAPSEAPAEDVSDSGG